MTNGPVTFYDTTAHTTRDTEVTGADWDTGMNYGSCMPGIGIALGPYVNSSEWTLLDQAGAARDPQDGQSIGGIGLNGGTSAAATVPFSAVTNDNDGLGGVTNDGPVDLLDLADGWTLQP